MTPEQQARQQIDAKLVAAGWIIQDYKAFNPSAGRGIALREVPLKSGRCDYLLLVDRQALGVVEAKKEGTTLSMVAEQSGHYSASLPDFLQAIAPGSLPFLYESTGVETFFRDERDPDPRSRSVFSFHRPETLAEWLTQPDTLRARLRHLPPLPTQGMRDYQVEGITDLEKSFAENQPRALIQMATGAGKTFTACAFTYRLVKYAGARRVLFLVDRSNLGRQATSEFQQFVTPDTGRKFTELYNVQHLTSNALDPVCRVMIATGTDIKPLECLLFLRDVRSRVYFEQMKGRGTRVLTPTDLQAVSGADARVKTHFVIVDAVGVCESDKTDSRPLEKQPTVKFDKLLLGVALGKRDEDTLTTLAGRLARLDRELDSAQRQQITEIAGGKTIAQMSATLLRAIDPNAIAERATGMSGTSPAEVAPEKFEAAKKELVLEACAPFDQPALRDTLVKLKQQNEQTIDTVTADVVTHQGFDAAAKEKATNLLKSFRDYIEQHQAEITALQILYSRPFKQRLTEKMLKELEKKLRDNHAAWTEDRLWDAFAVTAPGKVKGRSQAGRFADLVALVRFTLEQQPVLAPFADSVQERFNEWLMDKAKAGVKFNDDQLAWLNLIRDHIATSLSIEPEDLELSPFNQRGGLGKAHQLFGEQLPKLLDELNEALAA